MRKVGVKLFTIALNRSLFRINSSRLLSTIDCGGKEAVSCWKCEEKYCSFKLFCPSCDTIQKIDSNTVEYFDFLGLEPQFEIDNSIIDIKMKELQKQLHPDKFATKNIDEKSASTSASSVTNQAYQILKSPTTRANYLMSLYFGIDLLEEDSSSTHSSATSTSHGSTVHRNIHSFLHGYTICNDELHKVAKTAQRDPQIMAEIFELRERVSELLDQQTSASSSASSTSPSSSSSSQKELIEIEENLQREKEELGHVFHTVLSRYLPIATSYSPSTNSTTTSSSSMNTAASSSSSSSSHSTSSSTSPSSDSFSIYITRTSPPNNPTLSSSSSSPPPSSPSSSSSTTTTTFSSSFFSSNPNNNNNNKSSPSSPILFTRQQILKDVSKLVHLLLRMKYYSKIIEEIQEHQD